MPLLNRLHTLQRLGTPTLAPKHRCPDCCAIPSMSAIETRAQLDVVDCLRNGSAAMALAYDAMTAQCAAWSLVNIIL